MKTKLMVLLTLVLSQMVSLGWHLETIEETILNTGELSVNQSDQVQFLSKVDGIEDLAYLVRGESGWEVSFLEAPYPDAKTHLHSDGTIRLFQYSHESDSLLSYTKQGEQWVSEIIFETDRNCRVYQVMVDKNERVHILMTVSNASTMDLYYCMRDLSGWSVKMISEADYEYCDMIMTLDDENYPHILYGWKNLTYTHQRSNGWESEDVDVETGDTQFLYFLLNQDNEPHLYYSCSTHNYLQEVYRSGDQWIRNDVFMCTTYQLTVCQGPSGEIRVIYLRYENQEPYLMLAVQSGETWEMKTICQSDRIVGAFTVDPDDNAHLLTFDKYGLIKYWKQDDDSFTSEWIRNYGPVGQSSSADIGPDQVLRTSYFDQTHEKLKYGYKTEYGWVTNIVDEDITVTEHLSMKVDQMGRSHIAYQDSVNLDLKLAVQNGADWRITTIATEGDVGYGCRLVIDDLNYAHIAYVDQSLMDLKYSYEDETGWHHETIYDELGGYSEPSLVRDRNGDLCISFCNPTDNTLRLGRRDHSGWVFETVAVDCGGESNNALCFDAQNNPHIIYGNHLQTRLKHASKNGDSWMNEIINNIHVTGIAAEYTPENELLVFYQSADSIQGSYLYNSIWRSYYLYRDWVTGDFSMSLDAEGLVHLFHQYSMGFCHSDPYDLYIEIQMPGNHFVPGDTFELNIELTHSGLKGYDDFALFVLLEYYGAYYFAPSFSEFDYYPMSMPLMLTRDNVEVIPAFEWPTGIEPASGVRWIAGATDPEVTILITNMATWTFGWEE